MQKVHLFSCHQATCSRILYWLFWPLVVKVFLPFGRWWWPKVFNLEAKMSENCQLTRAKSEMVEETKPWQGKNSTHWHLGIGRRGLMTDNFLHGAHKNSQCILEVIHPLCTYLHAWDHKKKKLISFNIWAAKICNDFWIFQKKILNWKKKLYISQVWLYPVGGCAVL